MISRTALAISAALAIVSPLSMFSASADGVSPAEYFSLLQVGGLSPYTTTGTGDVYTPTPGTTTVNAYGATMTTTNNYATPSLQAEITIPTTDPAFGLEGDAQSVLVYFLRINGPTGSVAVNVQANGQVSLSGVGNANARILLSGDIDNLNQSLSFIACTSCSFGGLSFALNQTFTLQTGAQYQIEMDALANAQQGGHAFASIDPFFSAPDGFTIDISANIGNLAPAAVPGPIVGAGLPGLVMAFGGFLAWRRRKQAA